MRQFSDDQSVMQHALALAAKGIGRVEPNPAVGAVVVDNQRNFISEGYHERFGGPHAEVNALSAAGKHAAGGTLFVTLEPCCHFGKTPPCADAVIAAGVKRVVIATQDPAPHVSGGGIAKLRAAGLEVEVGLAGEEARQLIAPFTTLMTQGRPYVHAKWAMSLDGKIATRTRHSKWISNSQSRSVAHELRGRMDAILVGSGTFLADSPSLTVRPPGRRIPTRIVVDTRGTLRLDSVLVRTAKEVPVLLATSERSDPDQNRQLSAAGVEVLILPLQGERVDLGALLSELGRRRMTNILVEGGSALLGSFFDESLVDEVHVFVAPKIIGGSEALGPVGGIGRNFVSENPLLNMPETRDLDGDVYIRGRVQRRES